ncbi:MAG: hypothetical protein CMF96_04095 [Candidatus Marinimicrobia bacterium]|nr:hypothetical protein [Candidatus Neomarinimicrobiota bacterium]|tara:strand:+ start:1402 stop:1809 length:408 start_codon:yes stop_codon:yes gene_type:complete
MKNPLDKLKKKKAEDKDVKDDKNPTNLKDNEKRSEERRKAFNEKPLINENYDSDSTDIKFKHLIETELNVIQKKAKELLLDTENEFDEKSSENYWRVSVNEYLSYVHQRSKIIIEQLSGESHAVNIDLNKNDSLD